MRAGSPSPRRGVSVREGSVRVKWEAMLAKKRKTKQDQIAILPSICLGGAVASWLVRSTPERAVKGSSRGRGHCVVFSGKTLYSRGASLHPGV